MNRIPHQYRHAFSRTVFEDFARFAERNRSRIIPEFAHLSLEERRSALQDFATNLHRLRGRSEFIEHAENEGQRYTVRVHDRTEALDVLPWKLDQISRLVRTIPDFPDLGPNLLQTELLQIYLVSHRVVLASTRDVVNHLVASVWDLGLDDFDVKSSTILRNRRCTTELKDAVERVSAVCKYRKERDRISHEGGDPSTAEVGAWEFIEEIQLRLRREIVGLDDLRKGFEPGVGLIADSIATEAQAIRAASANLMDLLLPAYRVRRSHLQPRNSDADPDDESDDSGEP